MSTTHLLPGLTLQSKISCPRCWTSFAPEETLWVAEHPDLLGDPKLGDAYSQRFLPTRFSVEGDAVDQLGERTTRMACPACHLEVPRPVYQLQNIFFSILGAPACGKSYFLASLVWQMRQVLPSRFSVTMNDADASLNAKIHEYEETQFLNPNPEALVALDKTEEQGDLYDAVNMGSHSVLLPRPFMFTLQPLAKHPMYQQAREISRVISLYDNAGESFLPGADKTISPVTRHLALSKCLFFCFDPTQDPRFRQECKTFSTDPQMTPRSERLARENAVRQDTILHEAIQRVRRHAGLREDQLHQRPLVIVVTKWDAWKDLLPDVDQSDPYKKVEGQSVQSLDIERVKDVSNKVEELLARLCPEIVAAGQGFAEELYFVPVSATGHSPQVDPETGALRMRPIDIKPYWVEVPMMLALHRWTRGLVGATYFKHQEPADGDRQ